jgi:hypothetical protein
MLVLANNEFDRNFIIEILIIFDFQINVFIQYNRKYNNLFFKKNN